MKAVATGRGCLLKPLDQTGKQLGSKPQDLPHREPLASARPHCLMAANSPKKALPAGDRVLQHVSLSWLLYL